MGGLLRRPRGCDGPCDGAALIDPLSIARPRPHFSGAQGRQGIVETLLEAQANVRGAALQRAMDVPLSVLWPWLLALPPSPMEVKRPPGAPPNAPAEPGPAPTAGVRHCTDLKEVLGRWKRWALRPCVTDRLEAVYAAAWAPEVHRLYPGRCRAVVKACALLWDTGHWAVPEELLLIVLEFGVWVPATCGAGAAQQRSARVGGTADAAAAAADDDDASGGDDDEEDEHVVDLFV